MIFRDLRMVLARTTRLSVCDRETGLVCTFPGIQEVPESYDALTVVELGMGAGDFPTGDPGLQLMSCLEIVTTEKGDLPW